MADTKDKQYNLTELETHMLKVLTEQQTVMLTNQLSFFAITRLGVEVNANTQFVISEDLKKLTIKQVPQESTNDATK